MIKYFIKYISFILILSCTQERKTNESEFRSLMYNVSNGWSNQDSNLALSSFSENAIYMQPPNVQFYQGHDQLRVYFNALNEQHQMVFHNLWFNEKTQTGAGEFTFSYGEDTGDTGVVVVELQNGKIRLWREYFVKGPTDFDSFIGTDNKDWKWNIDNYP